MNKERRKNKNCLKKCCKRMLQLRKRKQQQQQQQQRGRGRGGRSNRYNVDCYNYGKYGHYASECYYEKKVEENANFVAKEETENNDGVLLTNKENYLEKEDVWYLDISASNHICGYKHMFTELKEIANGHVF
jgi:hypothetical protein